MKTIVFPTDFSTASTRGLPVAAQLARLLQARLDLVHVVPLPSPNYLHVLHNPQDSFTQALEQIRQAFDTMLELPCLQAISVKTHVLHSADLADVLTDDVLADADLLVMTSAGAFGWKELFGGSNAEHIIRQAPMPVLVLKDAPHYLDLKTVVFATDFQGHYEASMDLLKELFDGFDCPTVYLLYVNTMSHFTPTSEIRPRMQAFIDQYAVAGWQPVQEDAFDVETALLDFVHLHQAELVVLGTHGQRGLSHLLEGSLAENVANHAHIPVLTLPLWVEHLPMNSLQRQGAGIV